MGDMGEAFKAYNEHKKDLRQRREPDRIDYAAKKLSAYALDIQSDRIVINLAQGTITFFPYTGWFCGQRPYGLIKGRGINNLLNALRSNKTRN